MPRKTSKLATERRKGVTQVKSQRANLLDAAERRILRQGLEHTSVADIAEEAGVTRMTLYRYFRDRDAIAFELAVRMLERVVTANHPTNAKEPPAGGHPLERFKDLARAMIRNFDELRDAYRYLGMFDHLYAERYPSEELADWYRRNIESLRVSGMHAGIVPPEGPQAKRVLMTMNTILSFLQQMAARGDLLASEQGILLREQLELFEEMIAHQFDRLIESDSPAGRTPKR